MVTFTCLLVAVLCLTVAAVETMRRYRTAPLPPVAKPTIKAGRVAVGRHVSGRTYTFSIRTERKAVHA